MYEVFHLYSKLSHLLSFSVVPWLFVVKCLSFVHIYCFDLTIQCPFHFKVKARVLWFSHPPPLFPFLLAVVHIFLMFILQIMHFKTLSRYLLDVNSCSYWCLCSFTFHVLFANPAISYFMFKMLVIFKASLNCFIAFVLKLLPALTILCNKLFFLNLLLFSNS